MATKRQAKKKTAMKKAKTGSVVKVAVLGFGTVGSSVARVLAASKFPGVELTHIFNRNVERKRELRRCQSSAGVCRMDGQYRRDSSLEC